MRKRFLDWGFFIEASDYIRPKYMPKRIRKVTRLARAS